MSDHVSQKKPAKSLSAPAKAGQQQHDQTVDGMVAAEAPFAAVASRFANTATVADHAQLLRQAGAGNAAARSALLTTLQGSYGNAYVQRVLAVARKAEDDQEVTPDVEASIRRAKGGGQPLDQTVRRQMEGSFGSDLSHVRVHTNGEADSLNQKLSARAFTVGGDIFFRQGAYNPGASSGRELIAHEMTHVVQQGQGQVRAKLTVNQPGDKFEQEADAVAKAVIQAEQVATPTAAPPQNVATRQVEEPEENAQPQLQRQPEDEEVPTAPPLQRQPATEEETVQTQRQRQPEEADEPVQKSMQRQPETEEEESIQRQPQAEEEEAVQAQRQPEVEKEPDATALQRQSDLEEETPLQRQPAPEEEEPIQGSLVQRQMTEEERQPQPVQRQTGEEEEALQAQRMSDDEPEPVQTWRVQRQADNAEEEVAQPQAIQRRQALDEETLQAQVIQQQATAADKEKTPPIQALPIQRKRIDEPATTPVMAPAAVAAGPEQTAAPNRLPTAAEKAAAQAKAAAARARAAQANGQGQAQTEQARAGQTTEQTSGQAAKQKAATARNAVGKKTGRRATASTDADAGNAQSSAMAAEVAAEAAPALADAQAKAPTSPAEDPAFQAVVSQVKGAAAQERRHAPAPTKAKEAQAAAVSPASEITGKAQSGQVEQMDAAETPGFNAAAFKQKLLARINALTPQTAADADEFKEKNRAGELRGELQSETAVQQEQAQAPLATATSQAPDASGVEPKPVTPLQSSQPGETPLLAGAEAATPKPKGQGEVEAPLRTQSQQLDQQMAEANVTEEQLVKSNEPEFQAAVTARQENQSHTQNAPQAYRQDEQGIIGGAQAEAVATAEKQTTAMHADRAGLLAQVDSQQGQSKSADEQKRAEVGAQLQAIYAETKSKVESTLRTLDGEVEQLFNAGAQTAKQAFEDYVDAAMDAYKEERYGGWLGWAQWVADRFEPTQPRVLAIFQEGRQIYINAMSAVIDNVVALIGRKLAEAKAEIANGKQRIQAHVDGLPADLQQVGQEAAQAIQSQFDELSQRVDAKQDALIDSLAEKYTQKLQEVDARIEQLKAENQTLYDIAADKIGGAIKTILELKEMLLGVLSRAAAAIGQIIADPIGFLGNLISGVKQGLENFVGNIGQHLKEGFISWLTGAVSAAGITLPQNWDLAGIFQFVMQLLGLTFESLVGRLSQLFGFDIMSVIEPIKQVIEIYQAEGMAGLIKAGLARLIGEERMAALLEVWQMIQSFISGSWEALWGLLQEHLGGLKELVFGKLEEFLTERVFKAGVTWLVSLFNPASAFIKACKAIYDIIMFFVERASQIGSLVNALIDSIGAIAGGSVGAAAGAVENALAKGIPVAIGFLSSLLGLGNVSEKVQEIIQGVRGLVDKGLNAIFNSKPVQMVVGFIKGVVGKITGFGKTGVNKVKESLGFGNKEKSNNEDKSNEAKQLILSAESQFIQDGEITQENAQKAASIAAKNPVFQSISVIDGKDSWDYQYVFRAKISSAASKASDKVNIKLKRPKRWLKSVREHLKDEFPQEHKANIKSKSLLKRGYARRHIVPAQLFVEEYRSKLNGVKLSKAARMLASKGFVVEEPISNENVQIAAQNLLRAAVNDIENVWVGDTLENSKLQDMYYDSPDEWSHQKLEGHIRRMKNKWFFK